jgi:hypothetical protein
MTSEVADGELLLLFRLIFGQDLSIVDEKDMAVVDHSNQTVLVLIDDHVDAQGFRTRVVEA